MQISLNTTFARTFVFSVLLSLLISVLALLLFRFFAAEYTAPYHAQSMVAKYQLIAGHDTSSDHSFMFDYLIQERPSFSDEPLPYYFRGVRNEIEQLLAQGMDSDIQLAHGFANQEVYIWFRSRSQTNKWIGVQLSHKNELFTYYGWAYVLLVFLVSIVPSYLFARSISRPIANLSDAAESFDAGGLTKVESRFWPKEIKSLSKVLLIASSRLQEQTQSKEEMLLGISHDLRTPLTRARLAIDFLERHDPKLVQGAIDDLDEMDQIIDQFITYAREGKNERTECIDICTMTKLVCDKYESVVLSLPAVLMASVSPLSFKRLLNNLLSNAVKHGTPPIEVRIQQGDDEWMLSVLDSGSGIPREEVATAIKPFMTLDEAGTSGKGGLGLAIVKRIAKNHHGTLEMFETEDQRFEVRVRIPYTL